MSGSDGAWQQRLGAQHYRGGAFGWIFLAFWAATRRRDVAPAPSVAPVG